jgi:hypothetical protein
MMRFARFPVLALVGLLFAAAPLTAQAPAGATGVCKDGTYTMAKSKSGACSGHGGVKSWTGTATAKPTPMRAPAPTPAATAAPAGRPAGATGACGDGTYTLAKSKSGACSNHGGVKQWFAATAAPAPTPMVMPKSAPTATTPPPAPTAIKVAPIAGAPATATALCNDGTYSMSKHRSGTCSSHKGVKQWLKVIPN